MPLFGPPDVEKLKAKHDTKGLIKALGYQRDAIVQRNAARALGTLKDTQAIEPLIAALKDTDGSTRLTAAIALGEIGNVRAVEPLSAALNDSYGAVRKAAADALGQIGWQPGQDESGAAYWIVKQEWNKCIEIGAPAVELLIIALKDSNSAVREAAAEALGQIGDARAVEPLIARLKDSDSDVREAAAEALGQIGDARAGAPLIDMLKDSDSDVREAAANALGQIGWQPGQDESGFAYWIAKQEWNKCVEIGAPAVESLIVALKDSNSAARGAAAEALGQIADARAVGPLIARLKDSDSDVREAAAEALVKIGTPAVASLIIALKDDSSNVRKAAASALRSIGGAEAQEALIE